MKKIAVLLTVMLCAFSFAQATKPINAVIGDLAIDASADAAILTIPLKEGNELVKDPKITVEKNQVTIDLLPAVTAGNAAEKKVTKSIVTSYSISQYQAAPQKITRIIIKTSEKCDFFKEIHATKIVIALTRAKKVEVQNKPKPVSLQESTKKIGEMVASSEELDKTDQFALQKGTMRKGDLDQIVPYVSLTNADLTTFLNTILAEAGFNLVTSRSVAGTIPSIQLKSVSLRKILDLVLKQNGFSYKADGNILRVATPAELKAEEESALVETRYFSIRFAKAADLQTSISPFLSGNGKIQSDPRTNTIIITDITSKMDTFATLISSLDTKTPQVNIEAKLIDLKVDVEDKLGIRWDVETGSTTGQGSGLMTDIYPGTANTTQTKMSVSPPDTSNAKAGQFQFGIAGATSFWVSLDALIATNDANLLANPRITTLDNKMATIDITQAYSYVSGFNAQTGVTTYASVNAGVTLQVTPQVNNDEYITLQVLPTVSSVVSAGPPPIIDSRTANTQVMIKDGDTFVIGGLIREDEVVTVNKVPLFGDIPLIGPLLFQNKTVTKTKRDLVVFMTPHIIK